jgi:hypothetical protein
LLVFIALKRRRDIVNTQREGEKEEIICQSLRHKSPQNYSFRARTKVQSKSHSKRYDCQWWPRIKFANSPKSTHSNQCEPTRWKL